MVAAMLRPAMHERLTAPAVLTLPFLQRMAAEPRQLRRAPSGLLEGVLSMHSVQSMDSLNGAAAPSTTQIPGKSLFTPAPALDEGEATASAASTERMDRDSAMGSLHPAGLGLGLRPGSGRAAQYTAAVKARLGRASNAVAIAAAKARLSRASNAIALAAVGCHPVVPEKRGWAPGFFRFPGCIGCAPQCSVSARHVAGTVRHVSGR